MVSSNWTDSGSSASLCLSAPSPSPPAMLITVTKEAARLLLGRLLRTPQSGQSHSHEALLCEVVSPQPRCAFMPTEDLLETPDEQEGQAHDLPWAPVQETQEHDLPWAPVQEEQEHPAWWAQPGAMLLMLTIWDAREAEDAPPTKLPEAGMKKPFTPLAKERAAAQINTKQDFMSLT